MTTYLIGMIGIVVILTVVAVLIAPENYSDIDEW